MGVWNHLFQVALHLPFEYCPKLLNTIPGIPRQVLRSGDIQKACEMAAKSPNGVLRTPNTINKFKQAAQAHIYPKPESGTRNTNPEF